MLAEQLESDSNLISLSQTIKTIAKTNREVHREPKLKNKNGRLEVKL